MSKFTSTQATFVGRSSAPLGCTLALVAALAVGGCAGSGLELADLSPSRRDVASAPAAGQIETGSLAAASASPRAADKGAGPGLETAPIEQARALRRSGDKLAAVQLLDTASAASPADKELIKERGLLALELGRIPEARKLLKAADDAAAPDWRVKSALGSAHAASGDHKSAQKEFAAALALAPDHPSILNNMALSYALEGRHEQAEKLLRRIATTTAGGDRAKQNLALILGLKGNIEEAREVSEATLPKPVAAANVSYLERLRSGPRISRAKPDADEDSADTAIAAVPDTARR